MGQGNWLKMRKMEGSRESEQDLHCKCIGGGGGRRGGVGTNDQSLENTLSLRDGSEPLSITSAVSTR